MNKVLIDIRLILGMNAFSKKTRLAIYKRMLFLLDKRYRGGEYLYLCYIVSDILYPYVYCPSIEDHLPELWKQKPKDALICWFPSGDMKSRKQCILNAIKEIEK